MRTRPPSPPAWRRLPVGAELVPDGSGAHFRVWAPAATSVEVELHDRHVALATEPDGYHAGLVAGVRAGATYAYRLDGGPGRCPIPRRASSRRGRTARRRSSTRAPSRGPTARWPGVRREGQVVYEMHVGTFTRGGHLGRGRAASCRSWPTLGHHRARGHAGRRVPRATSAGATTASICSRRRASTAGPTTSARFVDRAHALGLGVILDVVYNHLGPDGNYLAQFCAGLLHRRVTRTEWGEAINFDGAGAGPVREFFVANAGYWIDEFHLDGLRLDATQDDLRRARREHILAAIARQARAGGRRPRDLRRRRERAAGRAPRRARRAAAATASTRCGTTTSTTRAIVALTGRAEAYYTRLPRARRRSSSRRSSAATSTRGSATRGRGKRRGTPALGPRARVASCTSSQNHDQVANSARRAPRRPR